MDSTAPRRKEASTDGPGGLPITLLLSSCTDRAACGQLATRPQRPGRGDHDTSSQHRDEDPLPPTAAAPRHTGVLVASRSRASRRVGFGLACGGTLRGRPARCLRRLVRRPSGGPASPSPASRSTPCRAPDHQRRCTNDAVAVSDGTGLCSRTQLRCAFALTTGSHIENAGAQPKVIESARYLRPWAGSSPLRARTHGGVWLVGPHRAHGDGQSVRTEPDAGRCSLV